MVSGTVYLGRRSAAAPPRLPQAGLWEPFGAVGILAHALPSQRSQLSPDHINRCSNPKPLHPPTILPQCERDNQRQSATSARRTNWLEAKTRFSQSATEGAKPLACRVDFAARRLEMLLDARGGSTIRFTPAEDRATQKCGVGNAGIRSAARIDERPAPAPPRDRETWQHGPWAIC